MPKKLARRKPAESSKIIETVEKPQRTRRGKPGGSVRRFDWIKPFLAALQDIPDVTRACYAARVSTATVYRMRDDDEEFAQAWKDSLRDGLEQARGELYKRAVVGWEEPVYQGGINVGTVLKKSDTCLTFLLKTHMPEVYGDKSQLQVTGSLRTMTAAEEIAASREAEESITLTIRRSAMRGLPNVTGELGYEGQP